MLFPDLQQPRQAAGVRIVMSFSDESVSGRYRIRLKPEEGLECTLYSWDVLNSTCRFIEVRCGSMILGPAYPKGKVLALNADSAVMFAPKSTCSKMIVFAYRTRYITKVRGCSRGIRLFGQIKPSCPSEWLRLPCLSRWCFHFSH